MAKDKKAAKELTIEEKLAQALVPVEEQPYKIPENWCWTTVDKVSRVITGSTPSKKNLEYYGTEFPFFKPADLDAGRHVYKASEYLSEEGKKVSRIIPTKSTVVCCIGSIGKCGYLETEGTTNQQINSAIPKINSLYLYYYMNTDNFINQLWKKASATTIAIVNKAKMETCMFPLAPSGEQQRIVDCIESIFFRLDEAKEKAQAVVDGFELRKSAILHKAFTGELTKQWRKNKGIDLNSCNIVKFKELGKLERGRSKHRPRNDPKLFNGNYPFIQTGDVAKAGMYIIEHTQTLSDFGMEQSRIFPKGTLCITIAANIGDVSILTYDCCFPDSVVGFTPNSKTTSEFIYYMMNIIQRELEANAPATAQKNINLKILNELELKIPSISEQNEILVVLKCVFEKEEKVMESARNVISQIDTIKKAILARAFRGELGTNDLTEEAAIEVLKLILQKE